MKALVRIAIVGVIAAAALPLIAKPEAEAKLGAPAPAFKLMDTEGKAHSLSDFKGKYVVLEWLNYDCPFVKKHYSSGNMQRLQSQWKKKGVVWLAVVSSAEGTQGYFPPAQMNARAKAERAQMTATLYDTSGQVGKLYGAKTTPHMYVINPSGELIYMGGIDDKRTPNPADNATARNHVNEALTEAMAGKPVSVATSQPYGCAVKYKN